MPCRAMDDGEIPDCASHTWSHNVSRGGRRRAQRGGGRSYLAVSYSVLYLHVRWSLNQHHTTTGSRNTTLSPLRSPACGVTSRRVSRSDGAGRETRKGATAIRRSPCGELWRRSTENDIGLSIVWFARPRSHSLTSRSARPHGFRGVVGVQPWALLIEHSFRRTAAFRHRSRPSASSCCR